MSEATEVVEETKEVKGTRVRRTFDQIVKEKVDRKISAMFREKNVISARGGIGRDWYVEYAQFYSENKDAVEAKLREEMANSGVGDGRRGKIANRTPGYIATTVRGTRDSNGSLNIAVPYNDQTGNRVIGTVNVTVAKNGSLVARLVK
jgi:hypothetical protein